MLKIYGLTGGIACGKSTVASMFLRRGVPVVDADELARRVVARGEPALQKIADEFGSDVLTTDGELDRRALGRIVFNDDTARIRLEAITHPAIALKSRDEFLAIANEGHPVALYEAALLVETNNYKNFEGLIVVTATPAVQRSRLLSRDGDLSEGDADSRIASQMPLAEKEKLADYVISNNGSISELTKQVDHIFSQITGSLG